jgi:hypothetical protein
MSTESDYNPESATHRATETGKRVVAEADRVWRENPVPVVLGALALGLAIGALIRAADNDTPTTYAKSRLSDGEDYIRDLTKLLSKATKKGYRKSAAAVKDSLGKAADLAHDVEDDYVDPASKWFRKLWKRCCE